MLAPNTLLQDRYLIIRLLAQGGMGAVYEAKDQRLSSTVALKETFFTDDALRKAFKREASLLATLRHRALPKVIDHFTEGDGQFLAMEFIRGDDLAKLLEMHGGAFPPRDVLGWGDQLLDALEYLHAQQPPIVHRDIKPQNLKLNERGEMVLLDFGLAKGATAATSLATRSVQGFTLSYAPLEQIRGLGTDPRSDLYSLAATLYHLMTGLAPPDALARAAAVIDGEPDPLRPAHEINPQVSPAISAVLHQAMAQDRNQRPASATVMRAALRQAADDAPQPVAQADRSHQAAAAATAAVPSLTTQPNAPAAISEVIPPALPTEKAQTGGKAWPWPVIGAVVVLLVLATGVAVWLNNRSALAVPMDAAAASKDRKSPTPLASKEILGRGISGDRYFTFTAEPGEIKLTLNVIASGATVSVELFDSESRRLRFENHAMTLSLGSSGHNEQETARALVDRRQSVLLRIHNNYPNDLKAFRLRLDGPIKLASGGLADNEALRALAAQFTDRDRPMPLASKELIGRGTAKDLYYALAIGPGEVKMMLNVIASGGTVTVELFDTEANRLRFEGNAVNFSVGSSGHNEQGNTRLFFDQKQSVLMRITNNYPNDTKAYRLRFDGPVELSRPGSAGAAPQVPESFAALFADRDQPARLTAKEVSGRGSSKDLYYAFTAEPGELKFTLNVLGNGSTVTVELFDGEANRLRYENNATTFSVGSSGSEAQQSTSMHFDREQPVLMRISHTYPNDLKNYRLQLDGAVKLGEK